MNSAVYIRCELGCVYYLILGYCSEGSVELVRHATGRVLINFLWMIWILY